MRIAFFASLVAYGFLATWYVVPWLKRQPRADALSALLWVNAFRYVVVYIRAAPHDGYPISDTAAMQLYVGDLAGAALAFVALLLLRKRARLGIVVAWLLIVETVVDVAIGIYQRAIEPTRPAPVGVWWLIFTFFGPLVFVSLVTLGWQLVSRRRDPLDDLPSGSRADVAAP